MAPEVGLSRPADGLCKIGFAGRMALARWQSNCVLVLPDLPARLGLALEVGFVGASRCFLNIYDELASVSQDYFFIREDYSNDHIQNSLLKLLLTAKFRTDFRHFFWVELPTQSFYVSRAF